MGVYMISESSPLLLASGSPRRRQMVPELGIPFQVETFAVDETPRSAENAHDYVDRICRAKLEAALDGLRSSAEPLHFGAVLVADTTVSVDGTILGKPRDSDEARRMVTRLCGRKHEVLTCFGLQVLDGGRRFVQTVVCDVFFRAASTEEVAAYVATGEGKDKAGAYGIQGTAAFLVERIEGSYTSVVGLPICELVSALRSLELIGSYP